MHSLWLIRVISQSGRHWHKVRLDEMTGMVAAILAMRKCLSGTVDVGPLVIKQYERGSAACSNGPTASNRDALLVPVHTNFHLSDAAWNQAAVSTMVSMKRCLMSTFEFG